MCYEYEKIEEMIQLYDTKISNCILHFVGNKSQDVDYRASTSELSLNDDLNFVLTNYFFKSFVKKEDYCCFCHDSDLSLNEIFIYASHIFDSRSNFIEESKNILRHLYNSSTHPKIKTGELYIAYFTNCLMDGQNIDAIGIFKSEHKDTFIKIKEHGSSYEIESQRGININKLDKGCIIYNTQKESGYMVSVVDNSNSGEAKYWSNDFLHVKPFNDSFSRTQDIIKLSKNFIQALPNDSKSEKAVLINKTLQTLACDKVSIKRVSDKVFESSEQKKDFLQYSQQYQNEHEVKLEDEFVPSISVIKNKRSEMKRITTIHLDDNFDICIRGCEGFFEQGYDDIRGQKFYKLYFDKEK